MLRRRTLQRKIKLSFERFEERDDVVDVRLRELLSELVPAHELDGLRECLHAAVVEVRGCAAHVSKLRNDDTHFLDAAARSRTVAR